MWICGHNVEDNVINSYYKLVPTVRGNGLSKREVGRRIVNAYNSSLSRAEVHHDTRCVPANFKNGNDRRCYLLSPEDDILHIIGLIPQSEYLQKYK